MPVPSDLSLQLSYWRVIRKMSDLPWWTVMTGFYDNCHRISLHDECLWQLSYDGLPWEVSMITIICTVMTSYQTTVMTGRHYRSSYGSWHINLPWKWSYKTCHDSSWQQKPGKTVVIVTWHDCCHSDLSWWPVMAVVMMTCHNSCHSDLP